MCSSKSKSSQAWSPSAEASLPSGPRRGLARRYTLYPDTRGLFFWLNHPVTVDPSEYVLDDFEVLPNLEMVLNVDAREALDDFATADVLILSLSSLGYVGGLLNPHGLVIYAPWWHPALPDWLIADEHGNLDAAQVAMRIADHLGRRSEPSYG